MEINSNFDITDKVSGLRIRVIEGEKQNRLSIEIIGTPIANQRDFYFTKKGQLDGTGTQIEELTMKTQIDSEDRDD